MFRLQFFKQESNAGVLAKIFYTNKENIQQVIYISKKTAEEFLSGKYLFGKGIIKKYFDGIKFNFPPYREYFNNLGWLSIVVQFYVMEFDVK